MLKNYMKRRLPDHKAGRWLTTGLLSLWFLFQSSAVQADIFRFEDDQGVVHFTNVPTETKYHLYLREYQKANPSSPALKSQKKPPLLTRNLSAEAPVIENHIVEASQFYGLDPKLVQAVIQVESNFDPTATSPKGAQGLMQLMPQTARDMQVADPFQPRENIIGGTRYLKYLLDIFNNDLTLALAAYNAGPEKVNLYRGIPPYNETKNYVQKVIQTYHRLRGPLVSNN
jgi:soluble lytic murein transglycosylase-like protein